jgi:hypothetical protein
MFNSELKSGDGLYIRTYIAHIEPWSLCDKHFHIRNRSSICSESFQNPITR